MDEICVIIEVTTVGHHQIIFSIPSAFHRIGCIISNLENIQILKTFNPKDWSLLYRFHIYDWNKTGQIADCITKIKPAATPDCMCWRGSRQFVRIIILPNYYCDESFFPVLEKSNIYLYNISNNIRRTTTIFAFFVKK